MTPAERDEVRARAQAIANGRPRLRLGAYNLDQCAIMRYVPAGDATSDGVESVSVSTAKHATNPVVLSVSKPVGRGRIWSAQRWMTVSEARTIGLALLAAADAAEEVTT